MNVLVTGANRGLGLEFVKQYAEAGATVYACCRGLQSANGLREVSQASGGKVSLHALDVANPASIAALAKDFGASPIDILINNAGIYGPRKQAANDMDFDGWAETFAINSMAPLRIAQAFHKNLKSGSERKLITITSGMGSTEQHTGDYFAYRSSKAAVNNVMHGLSLAWKADGITVVVIHPGWVKTDMGGPNAALEPHESIAGMRRVIAKLTQADSGKFFDYRGHNVAW